MYYLRELLSQKISSDMNKKSAKHEWGSLQSSNVYNSEVNEEQLIKRFALQHTR